MSASKSVYRRKPMRKEQALNPMMVAHGEGADTTFHPLDKPCVKCRPPFEITDEMVERAAKAYADFPIDDTFPLDDDVFYFAASGNGPAVCYRIVRAALEAAINA